MLRRLYSALSGTSLLLCLLVLALWARSGLVRDLIQFGRGNEELHTTWGDHVTLRSASGVIGISFTREWPVDPPAQLRKETWYFQKQAVKPVGSAARRWFSYQWRTAQRSQHNWLVGDCLVAITDFTCRIPHWFLAFFLALPPTLRWVVPWWRRRARRRRGQCVRCGYDLRGGGGRCPECGAEVTASPTDAHSVSAS